MIVSRGLFPEVIEKLAMADSRSVDTETTGLQAYKDDRIFSIIISDSQDTHYFNFQEYPGLVPEWVLPREWVAELKRPFLNARSTWYAHNAKFDLAMLAKEGIEVRGVVHCTEALGRVIRNDHLTYSLADSAKRIGFEKSDAVEKYIAANGLWEWEQIPGKKTRRKRPFYDKVSYDIIVPYGLTDGKITLALGKYQEETITEISKEAPENAPKLAEVADNERRLTKTCFRMEQVGIRVDLDYCREAAQFEEARYQLAAQEFEKLSGEPFKDSPKALAKSFSRVGEVAGETEKGNPSFTDEVLEGLGSPLAKLVQEYRDAYKKANTYYRNFLYFADRNGILHANIRQSGTGSGRVSYSDPNLQNVTKEEDTSARYLVRRAFIPRPGKFFFMLDYDQQEYRMMLDYAGWIMGYATPLIQAVQGGLDVHQATKERIDALGINLTRTRVKNGNFAILYGAGAETLAKTISSTIEEARALKEAIFRGAPEVQAFIRMVMRQAERKGYIHNWLGRRSYFPDPNFAYKAPNYLIQGGCGDVMKVAMNRLDELLEGKKTKMLIQVHDELLFEGDESELGLIPQIREVMETVYPSRYLKLTAGVDHSVRSWADKVEGAPT